MAQSKAVVIFGVQLLVLGALVITTEQQEEGNLNCGDNKKLTVAWGDLPPYIFPRNASPTGETSGLVEAGGDTSPEGALHNVLFNMTSKCCGKDYSLQFLEASGSARELEGRHGTAALVLPVTREPAMLILDELASGQTFLPVIETPGSFILIDASVESNTILVSLAGSWPLALVIMAAAGVAGIIIWLLERRYNKEEFPLGFLAGAGEGTWWAFVTMTTVGYGDKSPRSVPARMFGLVWMFVGIVLMSVFTATLVMAFDAAGVLGDIKGASVGVIWGSLEEHVAFYEGATVVAYPSITDVIRGLKSREVDVALVELNYALYALEELDKMQIEADHILKQESVHGILVHDMPADVISCFAREITRSKFDIMDFIMKRTGRLERKSASNKVNEKAGELMSTNIMVAYILFGSWLVLVMICLIWEFCYFRKKQQARESKENEGGGGLHGLQPISRSQVQPHDQ